MTHAARRKAEIKTEGYGRVTVLPQKPREGPACEKCRNLVVLGPKARSPGCAQGRMLDPVNCPDFKDASRDSMSTYNVDYDGRTRR